jgi:hypothetical protein
MPASEIADIANRVRSQARLSVEREKQTCTNTPNHNKELGPARNQEDFGWCYAFAASDALSYLTGKKISAAALAINNNAYFSAVNHLFQPNCSEGDIGPGGDSMASIFFAKTSGGACLESEVPSQDSANTTLYSVLKSLDTYKRTHKASDLCMACIEAYFPQVNPSTLTSIIERSTREQLAKNLEVASCKTKVKLDNIKIRMKFKPTDGIRNVLDELDGSISSNTVPVIAFASSMIYNIDAKPEEFHQMVVVSRRFNTKKNTCEYLVRNSWGPGCRSYDKRLGCVQGSGSAWIEKSILARGLLSVESFH